MHNDPGLSYLIRSGSKIPVVILQKSSRPFSHKLIVKQVSTGKIETVPARLVFSRDVANG